MDRYTAETMDWLDERYRKANADGVYIAHQPIYGFRVDPYDRGLIPRYIRTRRILDVLAGLAFESFVDIGGAEGFTAWRVQQVFGGSVEHSDLSSEACARAREIFDLTSTQADVHSLPWPDDHFDVVLCSETVEHVSDPVRAIAEVLRIARCAAIITVPHEEQLADHGPHAHIHQFDLSSFDYLREQGWSVQTAPMVHPASRVSGALIDGRKRPQDEYFGWRKAALGAFNRITPFLRSVTGAAMAAHIIDADAALCERTGRYEALIALVARPDAQRRLLRGPSSRALLAVGVPHHRLPADL
jgi:SAM-dependent methyltransferase